MEKALTVLMVEDDKDECNKFIGLLGTIRDIRLVGVTDNEKEALNNVKDFMPDVVILDIELHKGSGNGIAFLRELKSRQMKITPFILVTTYNISRFTHDIIRQLGVDFIMLKSQDDYCPESVIIFLRSLKMTLQEIRRKIQIKNKLPEESYAEVIRRQETRITAEVEKVGISPKATGRSYLIDAIICKVEGKSDQSVILAKKYGKTISSIERAMQNAINKAWSTMQPEELSLHYTSKIHSEKGVPTITEFVCHYANKIKAEYR